MTDSSLRRGRRMLMAGGLAGLAQAACARAVVPSGSGSKPLDKHTLMKALGLDGHFEGGYFRETFKATHRDLVDTPRRRRTTMTVIYYMLTDDSRIDGFHTKYSDGIQFYHLGAPVTYHLIHPDGRHDTVVLGPDIANGHQLQLAVTGGIWYCLESFASKSEFASYRPWGARMIGRC